MKKFQISLAVLAILFAVASAFTTKAIDNNWFKNVANPGPSYQAITGVPTFGTPEYDEYVALHCQLAERICIAEFATVDLQPNGLPKPGAVPEVSEDGAFQQ